jgi:hypothetical protein
LGLLNKHLVKPLFNVVAVLLNKLLFRRGILLCLTHYTAFTLLYALINKDRGAARKQETGKIKVTTRIALSKLKFQGYIADEFLTYKPGVKGCKD